MMRLSEVATAVNGRMQGEDVWVKSVGSDSRAIQAEQLFVAIKGERFDGNQYASDAIKQGANAVLISDETLNVEPSVRVENTTLALGELASHWRKKMTAPVVAITGSNGKTTTKEMLNSILSAHAESVHATAGNLNNDIGMPLTLLKAKQTDDYIVLEMGMNHLGEICYLANLAQPNVAVVINAGTAHIGELGSKENIAKAKGEIFTGLGDDGIAIVNADDDFADYWIGLNTGKTVLTFGIENAADIRANYAVEEDHFVLDLAVKGASAQAKLYASGEHNVYNALAAIATAVALDVPVESICKGLANFAGVGGRLQSVVGFNGAMLIDDTYNANPDSMRAAIDVLSKHQGETIFVMGDMGELGEQAAEMHEEIGTYARKKGIDQLLTVGADSQQAAQAFGHGAVAYQTQADLITALVPSLHPQSAVLVKGSRFMRMENVVKQLQGQLMPKGEA